MKLAAADARLRVADCFAGRLNESPYFANYERLTVPRRLAVAGIGGEPVVACMYRESDAWAPRSVVRLELAGERIVRMVDYTHCPWVLPASISIVIAHVAPAHAI